MFTTIQLITILSIIGIHFFADAFCQTHEDATNKWKSKKALTNHVLTYTGMTTVLWGFLLAIIGYLSEHPQMPDFILLLLGVGTVTFVTHWITDYFTSKWVHNLFEKKDFHNGFVVILCIDQMLHFVTLFLTLNYLVM